MNLISLNDFDVPTSTVECDVCIVGAGAAGLYLAHKLEHAGVQVTILDAGPKVCVDGSDIGIEARFSADPYKGATDGRAFGFGGTTSRWGGLLVPYRHQDLRPAEDPHSKSWHKVIEVVEKHSKSVAAALGLPINPADPLSAVQGDSEIARRLEKAGLDLDASTWLPFRKRHLGFLKDRIRSGSDSATVILDAVACDWGLMAAQGNGAGIRSVEARSIGEKKIVVGARAFVIAAGAIEAPRILQEINLSNGGNVITGDAAVGRYLSDHLSCRVAEVPEENRSWIARHFGPIFSRGIMRAFRFTEAQPLAHSPRFFAHFLFQIDNPGFRFARDCLQGIQARTMSAVNARDALAGISDLFALAYSRWARSRLYISPGTRVSLQMDMEQWPNWDNSVLLGSATDRYGRPMAEVRWSIGERDLKSISEKSASLMSNWSEESAALPGLIAAHGESEGSKPHDAYHPVGTCRLGEDREAVVDSELKVRGTTNLFVLSTAIFASAGTANPTFSLFCFAEKLAKQLQKEFVR